jgi:hypothetical protein
MTLLRLACTASPLVFKEMKDNVLFDPMVRGYLLLFVVDGAGNAT